MAYELSSGTLSLYLIHLIISPQLVSFSQPNDFRTQVTETDLQPFGLVPAIMNGEHIESPILQILGVRRMSGSGGSARHRVFISDGVHVNTYAVLASALNDKLACGELEEYSVIKVTRYICSTVPSESANKRHVMVILDLNVIAPGAEVGHRIGSPQGMSVDGQLPTPVAAAAVPVAPTRDIYSALTQVAPVRRLPAVTQGGIPSWVAARIPPPLGRQSGDPGSSQNLEVNSTMNPKPIPSLTPYDSYNWCIKGRVTNKSSVRSWTKNNRTGKLFSFDVVDRFGEIRITAFQEQCDKFFDVIEVGNVYTISRGTVKVANRQYSSVVNDFEVTLNVHSAVNPVLEDSPDIPSVSFKFEPLAAVSNKKANDHLDIIGICRNAEEVVTLTARSSKELKKRELNVVDRSLVSASIPYLRTL